MKTRLLEFVDLLRRNGLRVTSSEALDAARAVRVLGVEPQLFREGIAAALVKDEADRAAFDDLFDRFFAALERPAGKRRSARRTGDASGSTRHREHEGAAAHRAGEPRDRPTGEPHRPAEPEERRAESIRRRLMARRRALLDVPLKELTPEKEEECELLVQELARRLHAHAARRQAAARRGRLDVGRTVRGSVATGGVPVMRRFRRRRPGKPDLVALCDLSHSVAVASRFFLALLGPAARFFRRVRLFGYVDSPVEIWLQDGHVAAESRIDLHARSDLGRVLNQFGERHGTLVSRNTVLLILGDARNNRRPPRADLLARLRAAAQRTIWLCPEARERWNTGDSAMSAYAPHCDEIVVAATLRQLHRALGRLFR